MEKKNEIETRVIIKKYEGKKGRIEMTQRLHEQQSKHEEWMKLTENERWAEIQKTLNYEKQGITLIRATVIDAQYAFDYPAKFIIDHEKIAEVVCYTATYTGQAEQGECVEVSGQLEISNTGLLRILVGSSREAQGEYIKVVSQS